MVVMCWCDVLSELFCFVVSGLKIEWRRFVAGTVDVICSCRVVSCGVVWCGVVSHRVVN